jgi:hypothetical protein
MIDARSILVAGAAVIGTIALLQAYAFTGSIPAMPPPYRPSKDRPDRQRQGRILVSTDEIEC